jgi:hypothetical protein
LPSEFKGLWDELVTEQFLDAYPDFFTFPYELVQLVSELFILVREEILSL